MRPLILIVPLFVSLLPVSSAEAQGQDDFDEYFAEGMEAYQAEDFAEAATLFVKAFRIEPQPDVAFALAQALRKAGDCKKALVHYRWLLETVDDTQHAAVEEAMQPCVEELEVEEPEEPEEPEPEDDPVEPLEPESPPEAPKPWYADLTGGVLTGAGTVAIGVGLFSWSKSRSAFSDSRMPGITESDFEQFVADGERYENLRNWSLGIGGVLLVGGVVRYLTVGGDETESEDLAVSVTGDGSIWVSGRF